MSDTEVPTETNDEREEQQNEETNDEGDEEKDEPETEKKNQKLIADLKRCRIQMEKSRKSIQKPQVKPFSPDIFNSLSPYYNLYTVNYLLKDLENQDEAPVRQSWGHRATALGVLDPQIAWRMDNVPGPINPSRIPGTLFRSKTWAKNGPTNKDLGSTRLPPLPMPSVPKFNQSQFRPLKMTFDDLGDFRSEMKNVISGMEEKRAKKDYNRTKMDWERMNLSELKNLPAQSRFHVKRAIQSYMGTSQGSTRALKPLTKEIWNEKQETTVE